MADDSSPPNVEGAISLFGAVVPAVNGNSFGQASRRNASPAPRAVLGQPSSPHGGAHCTSCGTALDVGSVFCRICGARSVGVGDFSAPKAEVCDAESGAAERPAALPVERPASPVERQALPVAPEEPAPTTEMWCASVVRLIIPVIIFAFFFYCVVASHEPTSHAAAPLPAPRPRWVDPTIHAAPPLPAPRPRWVDPTIHVAPPLPAPQPRWVDPATIHVAPPTRRRRARRRSVIAAAVGKPDNGTPKECYNPWEKYREQRVCSQQTRNEWRRRAAAPRPQSQDVCRVDPSTGRILCDEDVSCHGGKRYPHREFKVTRSMEYDCSKCQGRSGWSCCDKCKDLRAMVQARSLKIGGNPIDEVVCQHCHGSDHTLAPKDAMNCSLSPETGEFNCHYQEHCEQGMPKITNQSLSFECLVTPCDTCADPIARATCCATCLDNYCEAPLSFAERKVCQGCEIQ